MLRAMFESRLGGGIGGLVSRNEGFKVVELLSNSLYSLFKVRNDCFKGMVGVSAPPLPTREP